MNGYERVKEKKKASIKEAARQLFMKHGLKDVKIEDIAQAAQVSQVTIYNHFGSKEALFRNVAMEMFERQFVEIERIVLGDKDFKEKVHYLVSQIFVSVEFFPSTEFLDSIHEDEEFLGEMKKFHDHKITPLFIKMVHDAEAKGEISTTLSEDTIRFCFAIFRTNAEEFRRFLKGKDAHSHLMELMHLFFYGIVKRE